MQINGGFRASPNRGTRNRGGVFLTAPSGVLKYPWTATGQCSIFDTSSASHFRWEVVPITSKMNEGQSYTGFASLPSLVTLSIPLVCYLVYHFVLFPLFRSDLRSIPGPVLAKLTDLYRLLLVRTGAAHEHHIDLHKRHGPFVRLGPNNVSVGSPAAIPVLYNTRTRYPKSAFYPVMGNVAHGKVVPTIFSTQDESVHESMKRPIAQVYAMTNLKTYEPLVESTESLFFSKLERLADEGVCFDLGTWLHWFATDVIMEITFGKRLGFLEREEDVDAILEMIERRFWYVAVVSITLFRCDLFEEACS